MGVQVSSTSITQNKSVSSPDNQDVETLITHKKSLGNDLLSQGASPQVPSVLASLTAGFEMGPGVSSPLKSPRDFFYKRLYKKHYLLVN